MKINKFKLLAQGSVMVLAGLAVALISLPTSADFDLEGLNQQVQHQQSQLDNHEARITNSEKDINNLEENTNTAPAEGRQVVPEVSSAPETTPNTNTSDTSPGDVSGQSAQQQTEPPTEPATENNNTGDHGHVITN